MAFVHTGGGSGDSKQLNVVSQLERVLNNYGGKFSERTKSQLKDTIEYQKEEARKINEIITSGGWE